MEYEMKVRKKIMHYYERQVRLDEEKLSEYLKKNLTDAEFNYWRFGK
jgi:hypothetical protein